MVDRPGEVKDFAKKIRMEDTKINMRKQQLEKIAQQRARVQAQTLQKAEVEAKDVKMSDPITESTTMATVPPVIAQPVPTTPAQNTLHPSLPLKPCPSPTPIQTSSPSLAPTPAAVIQTQPSVRSTPPPAPAPASVQAPTLPPDSIIAKYEETKHRWSWIALRTARDNYLQHFGKIGPGDIVQLEVEIEKEKKEREEAEAEAAATMKVDSAGQNGDGNEEQTVSGSSEANGVPVVPVLASRVRGDVDVKME